MEGQLALYELIAKRLQTGGVVTDLFQKGVENGGNAVGVSYRGGYIRGDLTRHPEFVPGHNLELYYLLRVEWSLG